MSSRDPRRNQPLVDYLTSLVIDPEASEAFNTAKQQDLVGTAMKALGWHFSPQLQLKYIEMYSAQLDHPFGEVRGAVADNLRHLSELRLHPSYSSVEVFVSECLHNPNSSLMSVDSSYEKMIDDIAESLKGWREVRESSAKGTQSYDKAALTSKLCLPCSLRFVFNSILPQFLLGFGPVSLISELVPLSLSLQSYFQSFSECKKSLIMM